MSRPSDTRRSDPPTLTVDVDARPGEAWDAFAEASPDGSFCHWSGWHPIIAEVMGGEPLYLAARDREGALAGILPLVGVESLLFGRYLVSMPFLNYGGPLGSTAAREALARAAREAAEERGADLLELRSRSASDDEASAAGLRLNRRKVTVVLPLPDDPEVLWTDGLRSKVRSQVRRPMKEGLETRFGPEEVGAFYHVFERHMRDLGTPVLPRRLFQSLPAVFEDRVRFAAVYRDGVPVAGGCGFLHGSEFEMTWASSLREHSRAAPNMLLYWRMMERAIEDGATAFNFGRCTPGSGTHRFKSQWGGEDEPLDWMVWSPGEATATPNPEQGRYGLAVRLWRKVPVGVARVLGPPLARRIP
jgi:serine/alanine adding enzyme